ncbi:MAG: rod shape-determining protein RodA, partial [Bacteroidales bacterium]
MYIDNRKISKGFDAQLIVYYFILVFIGWFTIFSTSYDPNHSVQIFNTSLLYGRQLIFIGTS